MTRKREFSVPLEVMADFADVVAEWGLVCDIIGTGRDREILVEVAYEVEEGIGVQELRKLIKS